MKFDKRGLLNCGLGASLLATAASAGLWALWSARNAHEAAGGRLTDFVATDAVAFAARLAFFAFAALSAVLALARRRFIRNQ